MGKLSCFIVLVAINGILGQKAARIGPDGKPLLNRPVLEECQKSEFVLLFYFTEWTFTLELRFQRNITFELARPQLLPIMEGAVA